jgi:hypothetical protein
MRLLVIGAVLVLGFALLVVAVAHNMAGVPSTQSASQTGASDASSSGTATADNPPALQVSVPELYQAYHANEVAADNEYKGKRLYLDAMVGSINKNAFGQVYLVLPNYYDEFDSVQAVLNEDSYGAAGRLQKGMSSQWSVMGTDDNKQPDAQQLLLGGSETTTPGSCPPARRSRTGPGLGGTAAKPSFISRQHRHGECSKHRHREN